MTLHNRYRTTSGPTASEAAAFILAAFPGACLLALTFYPDTVLPWLARVLEVLS